MAEGKGMAKKIIKLIFPQELIGQPIIYTLSAKFNVIFNIRKADIENEKGWVALELEGQAENIQKALDWVTRKGVKVEPVVGDTEEG